MQRSNNDDWKIRLESLDAKDARAIDIKHNLSCYVRYVPISETVIAPDDSDSNRTRTIAAEFYSLVKKADKEGKVFTITDVSTTYKDILKSIVITNIPTRRQLKEQIADNISDVQRSIFNAANVIRDDIIQMRTNPWKFEGLDITDRDKHIPHTLYSLIRWITQVVVVVNHCFTSLFGTKGLLSDIIIR